MKKRQIRIILANAIIVFPIILLIGLMLHFSSLQQFFNFNVKPKAYNPEHLFRILQEGRRRYVLAHSFVYAAVPLMALVILVLGYLLYRQRPWLAFIGTSMGMLGTLFMSGVLAAWLCFAAVGRVDEQYMEGAKATLMQLTAMTGPLKAITELSYLSLLGLIMLSLGLMAARVLPKWSCALIAIGAGMIAVFMDMDNWMLLGTILILIGLVPVSRKFKEGS